MLRCAHLGLPARERRQCRLLVVRHRDGLAGGSAWRFFGDSESIGRFERYLRCRPNRNRMSPKWALCRSLDDRFWPRPCENGVSQWDRVIVRSVPAARSDRQLRGNQIANSPKKTIIGAGVQ